MKKEVEKTQFADAAGDARYATTVETLAPIGVSKGGRQ